MAGNDNSNPNKGINKRPFGEMPFKEKNLSGPCDSDTRIEILGAQDKGSVIDAVNSRMAGSKQGQGIGRVSIGGEENIFKSNIHTYASSGDYVCIGGASVNERIVEFWTDKNKVSDNSLDFVTINGSVVSYAQWLFNFTFHLQIDINENSIGGELYFADDKNIPCCLLIQDMIDNISTQKYFTQFNRSLYEVNAKVSNDQIIFTGLTDVGNGSGNPVGCYSYSHRYISNDGSQSAWSPYTPLIAFPNNYEFSTPVNSAFPYLKTEGTDSSPTIYGRYGATLKVRINNKFNYNFIQIAVISYNAGNGLGFSPPATIVYTAPISPQQFNIFTYIDCQANRNTNTAISAAEELSVTSSIASAKAIRYYANKLVLGNITYQSRIPSPATFLTSAHGNVAFPIIEDIGLGGHKIDLNHCYKKSLMNGEVYGWYAVYWDDNFQKSFAIGIPGFESFQMPNKRDKMSSLPDSTNNSTGVIKTVTTGVSTDYLDFTFEVVDNTSLIQKTPRSTDGTYTVVNNILNTTDKGQNIYVNSGSEAGYNPVKPVSPESNTIDDVRFTTSVWPDASGDVAYNPYLYAPRYNSLGLGITGLDTWPSWARSCSIVRSKPAGRVICQGFAFYNLEINTVDGGTNQINSKSLNSFVAHIPDIINGIVDASVIEDIMNNPSNYQIQLVSPLGFGTEEAGHEYYGASGGGNVNADYQLDTLLIARLEREDDASNKRVNVGEAATSVGYFQTVPNIGIVQYGCWRNNKAQAWNPSGTWNGDKTSSNIWNHGGNFLWDISSVVLDTKEEDGVANYIIELSSNLYSTSLPTLGTGSTHYFLDEGLDNSHRGVCDFHEPVYMFNIVRNSAVVPQQDLLPLLQTGAYIKFNSTIGIGNNTSNQYLQICGERTEDYTNGNNLYDNYIYINDNAGNIKPFIDITNKTGGQITSINGAISGHTQYSSDLSKQPAIFIFGTYTVDNLNNITLNTNVSVGFQIEVHYDNRFCIKVFGGDTFVGQVTAPIVQRSIPAGGKTSYLSNTSTPEDSCMLTNLPLPYNRYDHNPVVAIPFDITSSPPSLQNPSNSLQIGSIRQITAIYDCQCRFAVHLSYGRCYPNVGYIIRGLHWDTGKTSQAQGIYGDYDLDYPNEYNSRWIYGGFAIKQFPTNLDFGEMPNFDNYTSGSITFVENLKFPTRVIWSLTRPISIYNSPNLKSFNPFNIFDLSDQYGEIKRFYRETNRQFMDNLYAFCEQNICLMFTQKSQINDATGNALQITETGDGNFIVSQLWYGNPVYGALHRDYWMTLVETGESAMFANMNSVFIFANNNQVDIARDNNYFKRINDLLLSRNISNYTTINPSVGSTKVIYNKVCSVFDTGNKEYQISIQYDQIYFQLVTGVNNFQPFLKIDNIVYPVWNIYSNNPSAILNILTCPTGIYYIKAFEGVNPFQITDANGHNWGTFSTGDIIEVKYDSFQNQFNLRKIDNDNIYTRENFVFSVTLGNDPPTITGKPSLKGWNGIYDYKYDKLLCQRDIVYGSKQIILSTFPYTSTWQLDIANIINGAPISYQIYGVINPEVVKSVEFVRIRIGSNLKPNYVYFYDKDDILVSTSNIPSSLLKNYHQFENYIPKRVTARTRYQGTYLVFKVAYSSYSEFVLTFLSFDYKIIR